MRRFKSGLFSATLLWVALFFAPMPSFGSDRVHAKLVHDGVQLGLILTPAPGWHVSVKQDGTPGLDPQLTIVSPESVKVSHITRPKGDAFNAAGLTFYGYEKTVTIPIQVNKLPQTGTLTATAKWLVCGDVCVPETETLQLDLTSSPTQIQTFVTEPSPQSPLSRRLLFAIASAFVGGLILNLMPCVFPVLSIKLISLSKQATQDSKSVRRHGTAFSIGMLATIWALAAVLISVQSTATALGWGFQLQSPYVVTSLIILFTLIGLNLFGVFEAGLFLTRAGDGIQSKGILGSVMNGALITIVATPCTAPFMGSALGYAITQPAWVTFGVLTALGIGLALPYLVLSWVPGLVQRLPKPGPWMDTLRQFLAFPMIASAIWLTTVLHTQVGPHALTVVWALLGISVVMWAYGHLLRRLSPARWGALLIAALAIGWTISEAKPSITQTVTWHPYRAEAVAKARQSGQPVFIDFTAEWCLTCQVNKRTTLNRPEVIRAFAAHEVVLFRADWTNQDPQITQALHQLKRNGVPVYVLYPPKNKPPIVLPELLSPRLIINQMNQLD